MHLARADSLVKSQQDINRIAVEYYAQMREAFYKFSDADVFLPNDLNQQATQRLKPVLPKYYELHLKQSTKNLFLVNSLHIDQGQQDLTCPAKTLIIYSHFQDF
jgi:hypothetical protein